MIVTIAEYESAYKAIAGRLAELRKTCRENKPLTAKQISRLHARIRLLCVERAEIMWAINEMRQHL